jgi:hypothetical protein
MSEQSVFSRPTCCPSEPASTRQFAVLHAPICCARCPSGSAPPHATAALTSIQISARAEQRRSITTSSQRRPSERSYPRRIPTLPKCLIRNPESARFSLFTITKGPRVITQGENFTTEYFYRLPSMVQRVLLEKECTGTGHQPSDVGVSAAFLSIRVSKGKKLPNMLRDAAAQRFRCQESKHTVLRDTSPRGNSALIEDFGFISCRCIRMWRRAVTTLPPREGKHDGDEVLAAHHDSAADTLHAPRVQP